MMSQFSVPVEDLKPEVRTSRAVERADNLEEVLPALEKEIAARPWLQQFLEDVRRGDKRAVFTLAAGSIVITAAIGYELGIARGRDLRSLIDALRRRRLASPEAEPGPAGDSGVGEPSTHP